MNAGAKKGLIWGLALTAVGVGIYYAVKAIQNKQGDDDFVLEEDEGGEDTSSYTDGATIAQQTKSTNPNKWLKKGMKDGSSSNEIEKLQYIFNQTRIAARKVRWQEEKMKKYSETLQTWIKNMASSSALKVDGDFGSNTEKASKIIMGRGDTSVCKARKKRIDLTSAIGFKNPYASWKNVCGKY